jgi:Ca2+-binding EF-hand superfamily protein
MSSGRVLRFAAASLLSAGGCASPEKEPAPSAAKPHRDPAAELRREHDGWWQSLAATFDRDGDGRITRAEFTRADDAGFARLDRDHDGVITRADFDTKLAPLPDLTLPMLLIRAVGGREATSIGIEEALAGMAKMDRNGDGRVDRAEFEAAAQGGINGIDPFATFLAGMDEDHDGLLSQPEVERWFRRRDADHDGRLVFRERDREGPAPAEGFIARGAREPAPDFRAVPLDGGAATWQLSSHFGERPVALIFGSFT